MLCDPYIIHSIDWLWTSALFHAIQCTIQYKLLNTSCAVAALTNQIPLINSYHHQHHCNEGCLCETTISFSRMLPDCTSSRITPAKSAIRFQPPDTIRFRFMFFDLTTAMLIPKKVPYCSLLHVVLCVHVNNTKIMCISSHIYPSPTTWTPTGHYVMMHSTYRIQWSSAWTLKTDKHRAFKLTTRWNYKKLQVVMCIYLSNLTRLLRHVVEATSIELFGLRKGEEPLKATSCVTQHSLSTRCILPPWWTYQDLSFEVPAQKMKQKLRIRTQVPNEEVAANWSCLGTSFLEHNKNQ